MIDSAAIESIRIEKQKYLRAFYALFLANPIFRIIQVVLGGGAIVALTGLVALGLLVWIVFRTYRFARSMDYGIAMILFMILVSVVPLINLVVMLRLLNRYKEVTGAQLTFLMFDAAPPVAQVNG